MENQNSSYSVQIGKTTFIVCVKQSETAKKPIEKMFKDTLQNLEQKKQAAEVEVAKPFAQEEELAEMSARFAELNALLNIDRDRSSSLDAPEETEASKTRPSVLAALEEKSNQQEPVKPFRSYYDKDGDAR